MDCFEPVLGKSQFVESAYAHGMWFLMDEAYLITSREPPLQDFQRRGRKNDHIIKFGTETDKFSQGKSVTVYCIIDCGSTKTSETINYSESSKILDGTADAYQFSTTFFDTPEGTRTIYQRFFV